MRWKNSNWSGTFSWITPPMEEIVLKKGVLVYSSPRGIIYNSKLIAADKAPRKYEDLIDPNMPVTTWAGKIAVPPLSELAGRIVAAVG